MLTHQEVLVRNLQNHREALLWKLEGLDEYDLRRPLTDTGTNLLGILKHVGSMEYQYFGEVFSRPGPEPLPWLADDAEDHADMFATAAQSAAWVFGFYDRACRHADQTIAELNLESEGFVPWWTPASAPTNLQRIMVHVIAETARHVGHVDILREAIEGSAGLMPGNSNLPSCGEGYLEAHRARLQGLADQFRK